MSPSTLDTSMLGPALSLIQLLVQRPCAHLDQRRRNYSSDTAKQNQATTKAVEWLLRRGEEVGAEPMARLTDTVGNSNKSCLLTPGRWYERRLPAQLQVQARVGTADEQDETKVARAHVEGADKGGAADCAHDDGKDDVVKGFLHATRSVCHAAGEGVGDGVRRSLDEVGSEFVKVEGLHDRWEEVLEALGCHKGEVHQAEVPIKC
jgi:hypothetical protein